MSENWVNSDIVSERSSTDLEKQFLEDFSDIAKGSLVLEEVDRRNKPNGMEAEYETMFRLSWSGRITHELIAFLSNIFDAEKWEFNGDKIYFFSKEMIINESE